MKKSKTPKTFLMLHNDRDITLAVYESYGTISRRLVEVGDFFEATTSQGKEIFAKRSVVRVGNIVYQPDKVAPKQPEQPKEEAPVAPEPVTPAPHHVPANNIGTTEPQ